MASVPTCDICEKRIAVPIKVKVAGSIIDVCEDCLKYGQRIEVTDIEKIIIHSAYVGCEHIRSCKGE